MWWSLLSAPSSSWVVRDKRNSPNRGAGEIWGWQASARRPARPQAGCGQPHGSRQNPGTQGQGRAAVERQEPPAPRVTAAGRPPACSTLLGYAGAHQLTLSCTLAELAIEPHSSYLGHPAADRMPPLPLELQPGQAPARAADRARPEHAARPPRAPALPARPPRRAARARRHDHRPGRARRRRRRRARANRPRVTAAAHRVVTRPRSGLTASSSTLLPAAERF